MKARLLMDEWTELVGQQHNAIDAAKPGGVEFTHELAGDHAYTHDG